MIEEPFRRIASLRSAADFRAHAASLGLSLECDDEIATGADSPLLQPLEVGGRVIGNRWTAQPMEGWDGTTSGGISEPVIRRWRRFGESGAKLIWGGEAMAVRPEGRANPNQLIIDEANAAGLAHLRDELLAAHRERFGRTDDLLLGFQLTHSGRFCRPDLGQPIKPRVAYRHPILDGRFGVTDDSKVFPDAELLGLVEDYVRAAKIARRVGADFVDVKHCHGYLLHEFLGARSRPGRYGGPFENRTRLFREIVAGIRAEVPDMLIGVRVSAIDTVPYRPAWKSADGKLGPGTPEDFAAYLPYVYGFGVNQRNPVEPDLADAIEFLKLLEELGIRLVNITAGSPYYNPHVQRPAYFPPSDGYRPPEDPLVGVARQIEVARSLKARFPNLMIVGTGYSYLQEYLPQVAQAEVRTGRVDSVGLGRMLLSYPGMLADATRRGRLTRRLICRTFSDCTTAPRNGLPSGCYPLDVYYKSSEDGTRLRAIKGGDEQDESDDEADRVKVDAAISVLDLLPGLERLFAASGAKILSLARRWDPADGAPVFTRAGRYTARGWTEWTEGFQHGSALLQYEATGEPAFLDLGRWGTREVMASHVSHLGVHDHGFNIVSTYGNLRRLIRAGRAEDAGDLAACELALKVSGAIQAARWTGTPDGGFIYSFNGPHSLFVDTIRSLRSLALASSLGHALMGEGDRRIDLLDRLIQHARATARHNVYYGEGRDAYDVAGRVAHESIFNPIDGAYRCPSTQQGYSPFSTWTRGLAWAILGFAEQLEYLTSLDENALSPVGLAIAELERAALATAEFYLANTPADGIPYWDTGAPGLARLGDWRDWPADPFNDHEPVDSSAAAIAAQGLLRLGRYLALRDPGGLEAPAARFQQAGLTVARVLLDEPYLSTDPSHEGLLLHVVYHRPNGWDFVPAGARSPRGESAMWGDYHLRELGLYLNRLAAGQYYTFYD